MFNQCHVELVNESIGVLSIHALQIRYSQLCPLMNIPAYQRQARPRCINGKCLIEYSLVADVHTTHPASTLTQTQMAVCFLQKSHLAFIHR